MILDSLSDTNPLYARKNAAELERMLQKSPPEIVFRYSGKTIDQERGNVDEV